MDNPVRSPSPTPAPLAVDARKIFLPYVGSLIAAMVLVQVIVALSSWRITAASTLVLVAVAVGSASWIWVNHAHLARLRFGYLVAHASLFVAVTTAYNLGALLMALTSAADGASPAQIGDALLSTPWFGAAVGMSGLWGLGLTVHLLGSLASRGWAV